MQNRIKTWADRIQGGLAASAFLTLLSCWQEEEHENRKKKKKKRRRRTRRRRNLWSGMMTKT
jgi:hypothetical protein